MSRFSKEFTVCWTIRNFCFYDVESYIIESLDFTPKNIDEIEWYIYTDCDKNDALEYLSIGLYRYDTQRILTLDVEIELCSSENEILYSTGKRTGVEIVGRGLCLFPRVALLEELNKKLKDCPTDTLVVRCRMSVHSESKTVQKSLSRSCTMQTTICLDESSYTRRVCYYESPTWSTKLTFPPNETVQLEVNIKAHQDDILFEISQKTVKIPLKIKCEITLLNHEGKGKFTSSDFFQFSKKFPNWHFPPFLKRCVLKEQNYFLLKFNFTYSASATHSEFVEETKDITLPSKPEFSKNITTIDSLTNDLRKMLLSKKHADVSFCVDGEVIGAHKNILSSRSPVFSAMFNQQMSENETGVIDITDMDVQTLKLFLEFLYTDELNESDWERMLELLLAAERYKVSSLKDKCSKFLKHRLSRQCV